MPGETTLAPRGWSSRGKTSNRGTRLLDEEMTLAFQMLLGYLSDCKVY